MPQFTVSRSRVRLFLMIAVGIVLVIAALDIVAFHKLSEPPITNDDGGLTTKGQAEEREDLAWGAAFTAVGASLLVAGGVGLVRPRPMVEVRDDGLSLRVAGPRTLYDFPWDDIVSVRSGRDFDDDGRQAVPILMVEVTDASRYPDALWGAVWDGNTLRVDADGWDTPVEEVVVRTDIVLAARSPKAEGQEYL